MKYVGWGIAAIALAVGAGLVVNTVQLREQNAELARMAEVRAEEIQHLRSALLDAEDAQRELDAMQGRLDELERAWAHRGAAGQPRETAPMPDMEEMARALEEELADVPQQDGGPESMMANMAKIFEGESGEKMAQFQAETAVRMAYDDFLKGLDLAPEARAEIRATLVDIMKRQIREGMQMMSGNAKPGDTQALQEEIEAQMRTELSRYLDADELDAFDEYQAGMEARMLGKQYEMQLSMFASDLPQEARDIIRDTIVEEVALDMEDSAGNQVDPVRQLEMQRMARERAAERLTTALSLEEYESFQQWMQQMNSQEEMARVFLQGSQAEPGSTPSPVPSQ